MTLLALKRPQRVLSTPVDNSVSNHINVIPQVRARRKTASAYTTAAGGIFVTFRCENSLPQAQSQQERDEDRAESGEQKDVPRLAEDMGVVQYDDDDSDGKQSKNQYDVPLRRRLFSFRRRRRIAIPLGRGIGRLRHIDSIGRLMTADRFVPVAPVPQIF